MPWVRARLRSLGRHRGIRAIFYATGIGGSVMEQETQNPPDSRVWDNRATEVVAEARKMPLGDRRRAALREAGRLRVAAETYRWLANK
jgi:hypothetical protein